MTRPEEVSLALSTFFFKALPIAVSVTALYLTLRDRRPRLFLRPRKSSKFHVHRLFRTRGGSIAFVGGVEVYNMSARANAIRDYAFWWKDGNKWRSMESQNYREKSEDGSVELRNPTPVTLEPYSGTEVRVMAFIEFLDKAEMDIRIQIEDLFGKRYSVEVRAEISFEAPESE